MATQHHAHNTPCNFSPEVDNDCTTVGAGSSQGGMGVAQSENNIIIIINNNNNNKQ